MCMEAVLCERSLRQNNERCPCCVVSHICGCPLLFGLHVVIGKVHVHVRALQIKEADCVTILDAALCVVSVSHTMPIAYEKNLSFALPNTFVKKRIPGKTKSKN